MYFRKISTTQHVFNFKQFEKFYNEYECLIDVL